MNTIQTAALISDYTEEDRKSILNNLYYLQLETKTEELKSFRKDGTQQYTEDLIQEKHEEVELVANLWVYKFSPILMKWKHTDIDLSQFITTSVQKCQYMFNPDFESLLFFGLNEYQY